LLNNITVYQTDGQTQRQTDRQTERWTVKPYLLPCIAELSHGKNYLFSAEMRENLPSNVLVHRVVMQLVSHILTCFSISQFNRQSVRWMVVRCATLGRMPLKSSELL